MKKYRGWQDLDHHTQLDQILKIYHQYQGNIKKIAHHITVSNKGTEIKKVIQYCIQNQADIEKTLYHNKPANFDRERHITAPTIGKHKFTYDIIKKCWVDLD